MSFVLSDAAILLGGVDLTFKSNSVAVAHEVETQDATVFGAGTRTNKPGLWVVSAEVGGFTDETLTGSAVFDAVGAGPSVFHASAPGGDGGVAYVFKSMAASFAPTGGSVGDMSADSLSLSGKSGAPLVRGTILHPSDTARTATGDGVARQLGAAVSGEKIYAALNVVAASDGDTLDVVVESDDNSGFTSPTTRMTFTQATAVGGQWLELAGPVTDDWWRITYTIGGTSPSFNFGAVVGIR